MICVLSPAKAMDLSGGPNCGVLSTPTSLKAETAELLKVCKTLSKGDLKKLMSVSDDIAAKDFQRYQQWEKSPCKAACLAMDGPAYLGLQGKTLSPEERKVAQGKVRILSGLYGVLKPFDAIRPYRLEMGCGLKTARGSGLYAFWGDAIAKELRKDAKVIVNAASQEYFKAVKTSALGGVPVITVDFPGPTVFAKRARGMICRFVIQKKCQKPEDLKKFVGFPGDEYAFDAAKSTATKYVFQRVAKPGAAAKAGAKASAKAGAKGAAGGALKRPAAAGGAAAAAAKRAKRG